MTSPVVPVIAWRSIVVLGLAAFGVVSAEFLPVGVLPDIAADNSVSLGSVSLLVVIPGLIAGISAPLIVVKAGRLDRKTMVAALMVILLISNLGSWLGSGFVFLLACRFLLGLALGGFWAIGPSFAARLAPARPAIATSIVIAGISAGTVLGLPLGTLIESTVGWRSAFGLQAVLTVIVLVLVLLPRGTITPAIAPRPFDRRGAREGTARCSDPHGDRDQRPARRLDVHRRGRPGRADCRLWVGSVAVRGRLLHRAVPSANCCAIPAIRHICRR